MVLEKFKQEGPMDEEKKEEKKVGLTEQPPNKFLSAEEFWEQLAEEKGLNNYRRAAQIPADEFWARFQ